MINMLKNIKQDNIWIALVDFIWYKIAILRKLNKE